MPKVRSKRSSRVRRNSRVRRSTKLRRTTRVIGRKTLKGGGQDYNT
jgi:hypothetical protein